jgi:hypothetical protein
LLFFARDLFLLRAGSTPFLLTLKTGTQLSNLEDIFKWLLAGSQKGALNKRDKDGNSILEFLLRGKREKGG